MAKHYRIVIRVAYDEATVKDSDDLKEQLEHNVNGCISRCGLIHDAHFEATVEEHSIDVERIN